MIVLKHDLAAKT